MPDVTCQVCEAEFWVADGMDVGAEVKCKACGAEGTLQKKGDDWVLAPVEGEAGP